MANYVKILIRRDTTANWTSNNPVLALGEIAADMDLHRIKVGNGVSRWTDLSYCDGDILDVYTSDRTDAAASAHIAKVIWEKVMEVDNKVTSGGTTIIDNLNSTRTDAALSANQGRELNSKVTNLESKIDGFGTFGMGYQVTDYNAYSKPTKITFEDGLTATLAWAGGTQLQTITGSNGEKITIKYNENGTVKGRTVTRA